MQNWPIRLNCLMARLKLVNSGNSDISALRAIISEIGHGIDSIRLGLD